MTEITYKLVFGEVRVYLGENRVGTIKPADGLWRYYPKGGSPSGEAMTLERVKRSLEEK